MVCETMSGAANNAEPYLINEATLALRSILARLALQNAVARAVKRFLRVQQLEPGGFTQAQNCCSSDGIAAQLQSHDIWAKSHGSGEQCHIIVGQATRCEVKFQQRRFAAAKLAQHLHAKPSLSQRSYNSNIV